MVTSRRDVANGLDLPSSVLFQYISDLHLELNNQYSIYTITPSAPHLLIAGDVGSLADYQAYVDFLRRHSALFKQIYLVLGNHEYHHLDHSTGLSRASALELEDSLKGKLTVLHRKCVEVEGVLVLGCTLWSHISDSARQAVEGRVKDYQHIAGWSVDVHNLEHAKDVQWLKEELAMSSVDGRKRVLVVTHHAPSNIGTSNPIHASNPWSPAFSTPLLEGDAQSWDGMERVKYWVFGHTHWTTRFELGGVEVVSNQRGYVRDKEMVQKTGTVAPKPEANVFVQSRTLRI